MLTTMGKASTMPGAPSRAYLSKISKQDHPPEFMIVDTDGKYKVDLSNQIWQELCLKRLDKNSGSAVKSSGKKHRTPTAEEFNENDQLIKEATRAKLEEQILKNQKMSYQIEREKAKLMTECGDLISRKLASFLYTGYMEKCNVDLLSFMKKIRPRIVNLCKENDPKGIEKMVNREITVILTGIVQQQKKELEAWEEEL